MKQKNVIYIFLVILLNMQSLIPEKLEQTETKPRVSIITSMFNGVKFIRYFLNNITQQTIFDQCELILINANSPENEEPTIFEYMKKFPNIVYKRLEEDPGVYGVWNMAIKMARADYIINANLDDGLRLNALEIFANTLDEYPNIDLVYSDVYVSRTPFRGFDKLGECYRRRRPNFSISGMKHCLPGNHPMWRKSIHEKYGYFDEEFKSSGDWEMWVRAVSKGTIFRRIPGGYSFYYYNPRGISTDRRNQARRHRENNIIRKRYKHLWR